MKTLEEIKNEYAKERGLKDWEDMLYDPCMDVDFYFDVVAKRFALEVAKEALKNASDNAKLEAEWSFEYMDVIHSVDKQSILSETNIPELK